MQKTFVGLLLMVSAMLLQGQQIMHEPEFRIAKPITVETIYREYAFYPKQVDGFNFLINGKSYAVQDENKILEYDIVTQKEVGVIYDGSGLGANNLMDYTFSEDEQKIILVTNRKSIYRRSYTAEHYIYDKATRTVEPLSKAGSQSYAIFSPDGTKVGFCRDNDLWYKDLKSGKEVRVTKDGKRNAVINGSTDWVYEEEFSFTRAFEWSADGRYLAFIRFDESAVKEFDMAYYRNKLYPEPYKFKYPKAGEKNALVDVYIYDVKKKKKIKVDLGKETDMYVPRIKWTRDAGQLCVFSLNRHQNHLQLLLTNATNGKTTVMLEEKNKYYVDIHDNLTFLTDGTRFIWTSEKDGYNHIYLYTLDGKEIADLTPGQFDVTAFYGVDEKRNKVYYQAAAVSPTQREVYCVGTDGKNKVKLTALAGTNEASFNTTFDYFIHTYSSAKVPTTYELRKAGGELVKTLETNEAAKKKISDYGLQTPEFYSFKTDDGVELNGYMIKPTLFDPNKKYPVFMYLYGGPGSQEVLDQWDSFNVPWFSMLADKGYIVAVVDNRGTGGRGEEFKKMTYKQLGKYETIDQIQAAKWLGKQSYVDASRIGIFGWSYGGYMSSLCLLKGNDVFKMAVAVAPVTNWKWYDTVYTERYMQTPGENNSGYEDNSPVNFAAQLKGKYLLMHGMADDNVHYQNSAEMINALIKAGKTFDLVVFPNENHGLGWGNRSYVFNRITDFILKNL